MSFVRSVVIPVYDFITRTKARQYLKFLEKSQWFTLEELRENQEKSLRQIIHYAYDTVPYYRRIFKEKGLKADDIKTVEDLRKLPVLKKKTIRENWDDFVSRDYPRKKLILSENPLEIIGGLVVSNTSGTKSMENTLESRLEAANLKLQSEMAEKLGVI